MDEEKLSYEYGYHIIRGTFATVLSTLDRLKDEFNSFKVCGISTQAQTSQEENAEKSTEEELIALVFVE